MMHDGYKSGEYPAISFNFCWKCEKDSFANQLCLVLQMNPHQVEKTSATQSSDAKILKTKTFFFAFDSDNFEDPDSRCKSNLIIKMIKYFFSGVCFLFDPSLYLVMWSCKSQRELCYLFWKLSCWMLNWLIAQFQSSQPKKLQVGPVRSR